MSSIPEDFIDGGDIAEDQERIELGTARDAVQRARIGEWLLSLLAGLIVGQYVCVFVLEWNSTKRIESLMSVFNATLPVVSGLVGSAVTYYFTRDARPSAK